MPTTPVNSPVWDNELNGFLLKVKKQEVTSKEPFYGPPTTFNETGTDITVALGFKNTPWLNAHYPHDSSDFFPMVTNYGMLRLPLSGSKDNPEVAAVFKMRLECNWQVLIDLLADTTTTNPLINSCIQEYQRFCKKRYNKAKFEERKQILLSKITEHIQARTHSVTVDLVSTNSGNTQNARKRSMSGSSEADVTAKKQAKNEPSTSSSVSDVREKEPVSLKCQDSENNPHENNPHEKKPSTHLAHDRFYDVPQGEINAYSGPDDTASDVLMVTKPNSHNAMPPPLKGASSGETPVGISQSSSRPVNVVRPFFTGNQQKARMATEGTVYNPLYTHPGRQHQNSHPDDTTLAHDPTSENRFGSLDVPSWGSKKKTFEVKNNLGLTLDEIQKRQERHDLFISNEIKAAEKHHKNEEKSNNDFKRYLEATTINWKVQFTKAITDSKATTGPITFHKHKNPIKVMTSDFFNELIKKAITIRKSKNQKEATGRKLQVDDSSTNVENQVKMPAVGSLSLSVENGTAAKSSKKQDKSHHSPPEASALKKAIVQKLNNLIATADKDSFENIDSGHDKIVIFDSRMINIQWCPAVRQNEVADSVKVNNGLHPKPHEPSTSSSKGSVEDTENLSKFNGLTFKISAIDANTKKTFAELPGMTFTDTERYSAIHYDAIHADPELKKTNAYEKFSEDYHKRIDALGPEDSFYFLTQLERSDAITEENDTYTSESDNYTDESDTDTGDNDRLMLRALLIAISSACQKTQNH